MVHLHSDILTTHHLAQAYSDHGRSHRSHSIRRFDGPINHPDRYIWRQLLVSGVYLPPLIPCGVHINKLKDGIPFRMKRHMGSHAALRQSLEKTVLCHHRPSI